MSSDSITSTKIIKHKIGGLGFLVKERNTKPCVTISTIVKGSTAEANGMLHEGDVILEVNGKSLIETEFTKALKILNDIAIGSTVALKLQESLEKKSQEKALSENSQMNKNGPKCSGKFESKKESSTESEKENKNPANGEVVVAPIANGTKEDNSTKSVYPNKEEPPKTTPVKKCPFSGAEQGTKPLKPVKLKNWETGKETMDTLHQKAFVPTHCSQSKCKGSFMRPNFDQTHNPRPYGIPRPKEEVALHAEDFIEQYYTSMKL